MQIEIDDKNARILLQNIETRGKNLSQAMYLIATALENSVKQNFRDGGRFKSAGSIDGGSEKWEAVKKPPKSGSTLLRSGNLMRSITPSFDNDSASVSSGLAYARIQNNGGKVTRYARSNMKTKKEYGEKSHSIPARPFMVIQADDIEYAKEVLLDHITDGIRG